MTGKPAVVSSLSGDQTQAVRLVVTCLQPLIQLAALNNIFYCLFNRFFSDSIFWLKFYLCQPSKYSIKLIKNNKSCSQLDLHYKAYTVEGGIEQKNHFLMKKSQQLIESTGVRTTLKFDNIDSNPSGLKKTMMPWQPEYSSMWLIVFRKEYEIREHSYSQISLLIILILKLWVCSGLVILFSTDRYFLQGKCKRTMLKIFNYPRLKWLWKDEYDFFFSFDKKIYTLAVTFIKEIILHPY